MDSKILKQLLINIEAQQTTLSNQALALRNAIREAELKEAEAGKTTATGSVTPGSVTAESAPKARKNGRPAKYYGCSVQGCTRPHVARGLCNTHYTEALRQKRREGLKMSDQN